MYSVMAAATGQASCVLREMGLGPRDRCTVKTKYGDVHGIMHLYWKQQDQVSIS